MEDINHWDPSFMKAFVIDLDKDLSMSHVSIPHELTGAVWMGQIQQMNLQTHLHIKIL